MIVKVMCRIADGQLRPGELEVTQRIAPLVNWSVNTSDVSQEWGPQTTNLAVELHLPDNTVWTGEAYPVADVEHEFPSEVLLRGTGALSENSIPLHADVVAKRIGAMSAERPD